MLYLGLASSCSVYVLQFFVLERCGAVRQIVAVDCLTPAVGVVEGALVNCDLCGASALAVGLASGGALCGALGVALFQGDALILRKRQQQQQQQQLSDYSALAPSHDGS